MLGVDSDATEELMIDMVSSGQVWQAVSLCLYAVVTCVQLHVRIDRVSGVVVFARSR